MPGRHHHGQVTIEITRDRSSRRIERSAYEYSPSGSVIRDVLERHHIMGDGRAQKEVLFSYLVPGLRRNDLPAPSICKSVPADFALVPELIPMLVDEADHFVVGRSSSFAKNTLAALGSRSPCATRHPRGADERSPRRHH